MTDDNGLPDPFLAVKARSDPPAFTALYRRYVQRIYAYHLARTGDEQDAQDLTSQTFLSALHSLSSYRPESSFAAWLLGIAHHKLVDHYRDHAPAQPLDVVSERPDSAPLPEETAIRRTQLQRIQRALRGLAPERAAALGLRYFADLNLHEIAGILGKKEPAIKMLIFRGLQDVRSRLAVEIEEEV
jgi:RNA polymerase sigma-70 factor (ECF subfamily)